MTRYPYGLLEEMSGVIDRENRARERAQRRAARKR